MAVPLLKLGTRGSRLALVQAGLVRDALAAAVPALAAPGAIAIVAIKTTGDVIQDSPLSEAGGKGLFVKEIEEALLAHRIDAAVHSMKDMPTAQPAGLAISAFLPREDVRDVLIAGDVRRIADLKPGAIVGTAALRRKAQLLHRRPDLQIVNIRGNVDTRLAKREAGVVEATLLALAGLKRLGLGHVGAPISEDEMLPAVGQGAVCIECRSDDAKARAEKLLAIIKGGKTFDEVVAGKSDEKVTFTDADKALTDDQKKKLIPNSDEEGAAERKGDQGRFRANVMPPPFMQALTKLKAGELSGVVETQLGYQIILRTM